MIKAENLGAGNEITFTLELQENDEGEVYIKIPDELMLSLGWELDDDVVFEETDGEGGFTLQNVSKQFRDAEEVRVPGPEGARTGTIDDLITGK